MICTVEEFGRDLMAWLKARELDGDTRFYTNDEWKKRGETYGNSSICTVTTEGDLNRIVNFEGDDEIYQQLDRFVESYGLFWELGYGWDMHFEEI